MRIILQRTSGANVRINEKAHAHIDKGLVLLVGIEEADTLDDVTWICKKIAAMRIFADSEGRMNVSINDVNGDVLVISQFTLHASTKKGNRPSFIKAAKPDTAVPLYDALIRQLKQTVHGNVASGIFGAYMDVELTNTGPVTIFLDSKHKE